MNNDSKDVLAGLGVVVVILAIIAAIALNVHVDRDVRYKREQNRIEACESIESEQARLTCIISATNWKN